VGGALPGRRRVVLLATHRPGRAGSWLRAETRARFPGGGSLYRAAVIGTRGHVLVTMRLLEAAKRRAER